MRSLVAALIVVGYVFLTFLQVLHASGEDSREAADAIVVLGAAQYDGEPSPVLASRLDHAYELWETGVADIVVTTGSNRPGDRFTEGYAGFEYLRFAGIPEADLRGGHRRRLARGNSWPRPPGCCATRTSTP